MTNGAWLMVVAGVALGGAAAAAVVVSRAVSRAIGRRVLGGEGRYRFLLDHLPEAFVVLDEGRISYANAAFGRMVRCAPEVARGRPLEEFLVASSRQAFRDRFGLIDTTSTPDVRRLEVEIARDGAESRWIELRSQMSAWEGHAAEVVLLADVTLRRKGELRAAVERRRAGELQAALYEISEATLTTPDLEQLFAAIHAIVGRLMEARNLYIAIHDRAANLVRFPYFVDEEDAQPAARPPGRGMTEYVLRTGKPILVSPDVFERLVAEGEVENVGAPSLDWLGVPLTIGGEVFGVLVVQSYHEGLRYGERERDILTFVSGQIALAIERKRAEQLLRESEEKYRTLIDRMEDGVVLVQDGAIVFANEALGRLIGEPPQAVVGRSLPSLLVPEDRYLIGDFDGHIEARGGARGEAEVWMSSGEGRVPVHMRLGELEYGARPATLITVRDLTERKRLHEELTHMQRVDALGHLAGGIAHDFNNILMAIAGSADLLERELAGSRAAGDELAAIRRSTARAAHLTRSLLAFAKRQVLQPVDLDLNQVVPAVLPLLMRVIPENIRIRFEASEPLGIVRADRGQIDQIIMNLAVNSRDAMPAGGDLVIETGNARLDEEYLETHPWARPGRYVRLSVIDDGEGMSEQTLDHIFEPFFTTKATGHGTGLGLATVYGIVKQHSGYVDVSSRPGEGTRIDIYFPEAAPRAQDVAERPSVEVRVMGGDECLLVVEDETEVRRILVEVLSSLGYRVLEAGDGAEALALLKRGEPIVDLVISDVVMPTMGGAELYRAASTLDHRPLFLFSSGYGDSLLDGALLADTRTAFIAKPYGVEELAAKVRDLLAARQLTPG